MSWLRLGLMAILVGATIGTNFVASAGANTWAHRYLKVNECCDGAGLYGTKSAIYTPFSAGDLTLPGHCFLTRSAGWAVTNVADRQIQTGWVRCASGVSLGGTCSLYNNLVNYVETYTEEAGYNCYPKGGVDYNTNTYYSVRRVGGDTWYAFIAGVQDTNGLVMGGAEEIDEGAEWTGNCGDDFHGIADFAIGVAWQRWTGSSWYQVQSSALRRDCDWSSYGGPPSSFGFWR